MGLCVDLGYEVVTDSVTATIGTGRQEFRVPAPTGKKPVGGGMDIQWTDFPVFNHKTYIVVVASYPDDGEWVFVINKDGLSANTDINLYVTCINT
jgi:hypothetical protein